MYETQDYDPMVMVAANRNLVRLKDGRYGRLVWWSTTNDLATVHADGKHLRISKDEVVAVVQATLIDLFCGSVSLCRIPTGRL